ncbi:MAG: hypothetical protein OEY14_16000, partial [Myxococcales bacterium]|nr:hypothetical protein [Myxococcales bacterium]
MGLRPHETRFFELLCPAPQVALAAEALARDGHVQLETPPGAPAPGLTLTDEESLARLEAFSALERRYRGWLPAALEGAAERSSSPAERIAAGLARAQAWAAEAEPEVLELERLELEALELELVAELVEAGLPRAWSLSRFSSSEASGIEEASGLRARLLVTPAEVETPELAEGLLQGLVLGPRHRFHFVLLDGERTRAIEAWIERTRARPLHLRWLPADPIEAPEAALPAWRADQQARLELARARLEALHEKHELPRALAELRRLRWYAQNVPAPRGTRGFAILSGWTDVELSQLEAPLDAAAVPALLRFVEAPPGRKAPVVLRNPRWVRPFEQLSTMIGVPSTGEVDPSAVLAVFAPLFFGFMFGDVGHGALLLVLGLSARHRIPALGLLVPGGIAAIAFGLAFGSIFCVEGVIPALWMHPMQEPLLLLGVSIGVGVFVLSLGLGLGALSALWRRRLHAWLPEQGALLICYWALLGALLMPRLALLALAAAAAGAVASGHRAWTEHARSRRMPAATLLAGTRPLPG